MNIQSVKILVVEDEVILLNNICKKISAVSPDFEIVGKAFNGKDALEIIRQDRPDIVFTDIRMPIMDGLELARVLSEDYPDIAIVIISGYDDFAYARAALTYRVQNYLLKPVKLEELSELLFSLQISVKEKRESAINRMLQQQLSDLFLAQPQSGHVDLDHSSFLIFLICFGNLHLQELPEKEPFDLSGGRKHLRWEEVFRNAPCEVFNYWLFPYLADNLYLLIADAASGNIYDMAGHIQTALKEHFPAVTVNISFGKTAVAFPKLRGVFAMLYKQLLSSLVIGESRLFFHGNANTRKSSLPPAVLSSNSINFFQTVISANNSGEFARMLIQHFSEWKEQKYPQQWVEKVLSQLLNLLQQNLYFSDETYGKMRSHVFGFLEGEPDLLLSGKKITEELIYWIGFLQTIPSEIENTIEELYAFIRQHYTENLNLAELADKYHFNHSYLTKTFKKQKGISPLKLINTLRIEDAKRLLLNSELSIREISEMLNFSDQHYFSRMFKEMTGQTPKEYRQSPREEIHKNYSF